MAIAKRIEAGQHEVLGAVANCGVTIREFVSLTKQVKTGEVKIFDIIQTTEPEEGKESSGKKEIKNLQKRGKALKTESLKLEKLNIRIDSGKLSEKMLAKVTGQLEKQQKIVEKMISNLGLSNDVMDETIEKIYTIAAEYRAAGKKERDIERQLRMALSGVKKLAKNWTKQKSVKLPAGKVITRTQYDNFMKKIQRGRRKVIKNEKETEQSKPDKNDAKTEDKSVTVNKDKDDNENGESAKDEVKDETQDEDPQIKNEKETEKSNPDKNDAKLKQNKEDSDSKDIDKIKS